MSNAVEKAYVHIREGITSGGYSPGSKLKEELIAQSTGVSRTPVREALRTLASEGLIEFIPNSGAYVASWTPHEVARMSALRALLEGEAAGLAAARIQEFDRQQLSVLAEQMSELAERSPSSAIEQIAKKNREFHLIILAASGDERLQAMAMQVIDLPASYHTFRGYEKKEMRRSMGHHLELVTAMEHRDSEWATAVMRAHIFSGKSALMRIVSESNPESHPSPSFRARKRQQVATKGI